MLHAKLGQNNPSSFREEAENTQILTHHNGQKRIAIGYSIEWLRWLNGIINGVEIRGLTWVYKKHRYENLGLDSKLVNTYWITKYQFHQRK